MHRLVIFVACLALLAGAAFATVSVSPTPQYPESELHIGSPSEHYWGLPDTPMVLEEQTDLDPGVYPEGDYLGDVIFSPSGDRLFISSRMTDMVTVYDAATHALITNITVGDQPMYMAVNDDYLLVTCSFSDELWVLDLDDYSTVEVFPTAEQPWRVKVSPDGTRAYVGCDIPDVLEVFDLTTLTHEASHDNFIHFLSTISGNSESGRGTVKFSQFYPVGNNHVLNADPDGDRVVLFNVTTGDEDAEITGIENCRAMAVAGNGAYAIAQSNEDNCTLYRIELAPFVLRQTVTLTGHSPSFFGLGVNQDATKAYMGIQGNQSVLVDMLDGDWTYFNQTYTAFWVDETFDHQYVISGQYNWSVISFDSESIVGYYPGYSQWGGRCAPNDYRAAGWDGNTSDGTYFFDFNNFNNIQFDDSMVAGEHPEGDAPRRAYISPNGQRAVVSNVVSDNVSVIDLASGATLGVFPAGNRPQEIAITHDNRWAVVTTFDDANFVTILDLQEMEIATTVPVVGDGPGTVAISPDDHYAYVGCISTNSITKIILDGPNSSYAGSVNVGVIGVIWAAYGVMSDLEITPDGSRLLVPASFDDQLYIIDAATMQVQATVPTGDFPIQVAVDATSTYAMVTSYFDDTVTYANIQTGSLISTNFSQGDGPLRIAYNPASDEFGVGNYYSKTVTRFDASTGGFNGTDSYTSYGSIMDIGYTSEGQQLVLTGYANDTPGHLHHDGGANALPAGPAFMALNADRQKALVCMPGPDWVSLFEFAPSPVELTLNPQVTQIPPQGGAVVFGATLTSNLPNPIQLQGWYDVTLPSGNIYGPLGVTTFNLAPGTVNPSGFQLQVPGWAPAGIYTLTGYLGLFGPGIIGDTDSFTFEKFAPGTDGVIGGGPADWAIDGMQQLAAGEEAGTIESALPAEYGLSAAFPNPFNPTASLTLTLPATAEVHVTVTDVLGRRVATLADGVLSAGSHSLMVDGNGWASGVYFVKAYVPGHLNTVQKVMLLQ